MKISLKRIICIFVCLCLVSGGLVFSAQAEEGHKWDHEVKTHCGGKCGYSPVIIVPGIMQSQTYVQDSEGNDIMTSDGFPIVEGMDMSFMFDTVEVKERIKSAVPDILKAVLRRDRDALLDILIDIFDDSFKDHYFNPDGTRVNGVSVDEYWYSLEECKNTPDRSYGYAKGYSKDDDGNVLPTTKYQNQYDFIERQVNISAFCEKAGFDHAYYYSYASFGNILESAAGLNEYIDMVKCQTGHDKVSLVFVSLGGTIANTWLADYVDVSEIDRIIIAAGATDGSYLLSDLMDARSTLGDGNVIYNDLIPNIVNLAASEYMALAYAGNVIARAIPEEVFSDFLSEVLERAINEVLAKLMRNCQSMWALVPSAEYPAMSAKYISDEEHEKLKEQTDRYYNIQLNAKKRVKELSDAGLEIFCITGYNLELPAAVEHYKQSSDEIIQSTSTSMGATFAPLGQPFGEDYEPVIDASYIDPERLVDAGSCALPDKTWFVKNQSHLKLQSSVNDVIGQCVAILTDKSIKDARKDNGGYPQFNEYRNLSQIESLIRRYDENEYAGKNAAVDDAYAKAKELIAKREWSQDETLGVEREFYKAMEKARMLDKKADSSFVKYDLNNFFIKITKWFSDIFEKIFKGNDFWLFFIPLI
ncbi:MAG: hypothetical protein IKS39_05615 [Clostridia bacterium]|nr:hypothetical protein [Clostridia bacterium]